jgi:hypothetical protein
MSLLLNSQPGGGVWAQGALDLYTVAGSPVRAVSGRPTADDHRAAHERILEILTTPGATEQGNELPVDLQS